MECSIISIKSIWSNVSFRACVSMLIFCLDDLSIDVSGVLKSLAIIVLLSISPFRDGCSYPIHCDAPMLGADIFTIVLSSSWIDPLIIM